MISWIIFSTITKLSSLGRNKVATSCTLMKLDFRRNMYTFEGGSNCNCLSYEENEPWNVRNRYSSFYRDICVKLNDGQIYASDLVTLRPYSTHYSIESRYPILYQIVYTYKLVQLYSIFEITIQKSYIFLRDIDEPV